MRHCQRLFEQVKLVMRDSRDEYQSRRGGPMLVCVTNMSLHGYLQQFFYSSSCLELLKTLPIEIEKDMIVTIEDGEFSLQLSLHVMLRKLLIQLTLIQGKNKVLTQMSPQLMSPKMIRFVCEALICNKPPKSVSVYTMSIFIESFKSYFCSSKQFESHVNSMSTYFDYLSTTIIPLFTKDADVVLKWGRLFLVGMKDVVPQLVLQRKIKIQQDICGHIFSKLNFNYKEIPASELASQKKTDSDNGYSSISFDSSLSINSALTSDETSYLWFNLCIELLLLSYLNGIKFVDAWPEEDWSALRKNALVSLSCIMRAALSFYLPARLSSSQLCSCLSFISLWVPDIPVDTPLEPGYRFEVDVPFLFRDNEGLKATFSFVVQFVNGRYVFDCVVRSKFQLSSSLAIGGGLKLKRKNSLVTLKVHETDGVEIRISSLVFAMSRMRQVTVNNIKRYCGLLSHLITGFSFDTSLLQDQDTGSLVDFYLHIQNEYRKIHGDIHLAGPALVTTKLDPATPSRAAKEDVSLSLVSDGLKSGAGKRGTLSSSVSKLLEQVREVEAQEKKNEQDLATLLERVNEFRSLK